jgi:hypothetical protein
MAKEKTDSNKQGWFARWRERRKQSKLRAGERQRRAYDALDKGEGPGGPPPGGASRLTDYF